MNNNTINYYNKHAKSFIQTTRSVDFTSIQNKFLSYLPPEASILDFGCGSGRDTKYFLKQNYNVTAIDGSEAICKEASKYTLNFQPKVALKAFWTGNLYIHSSLDLFGSHPDVMLFRIFKCGL